MDFLLHFFAPQSSFLFTSLDFWIFLCLVLGGFSLCYKNRRTRNLFLFACSLFFYYKIAGFFIVILLLSVFLNYRIGKHIEKSPAKRYWMTVGILTNLLILGVFRYNVFFVELWNAFWGTGLQAIDYLSDGFSPAQTASSVERLLPPVGLAFFTFQAMSYLIDLKRGRIQSAENLTDFGFYMTFFPQLAAGPIVRADEFMPQLKRHYMLTRQEFSYALVLIACGLFKKSIVADYLSLHLVSPVFDNPDLFLGITKWMAVYGFSLQIYCDFSGYTDIALGIAALFGFQLPVNFRSPYKASSLTDFWRRWHITLSSWFRDYLYIPLGGNRKGLFRMVSALMITMLAAGFWHGAGLGFLIWGGIHGIALCIEKLSHWHIKAESRKGLRLIGWFITFHVVSLTWIFFRCPTLQNAADMFFGLFDQMGWMELPHIIVQYGKALLLMTGMFLFLLVVRERQKKSLARHFERLPILLKFIAVLAVVFLLIHYGNPTAPGFLYASF